LKQRRRVSLSNEVGRNSEQSCTGGDSMGQYV